MKLYYSAGSCSTSCHITLEESGLKYEAIEVDWDQPSDPNIEAVARMNPLGTLPILITDDGKQLDQNLAIHTYLADLAPTMKLLPPAGSYARSEAMNMLSFIAADLHKAIGGMFSLRAMSEDANVQAQIRKYMLERAQVNLAYLDTKLAGKDYLLGQNFSVADAYAFVVLSWTKYLEIPTKSFKNIEAYQARVAARPAVAHVFKVEGLT